MNSASVYQQAIYDRVKSTNDSIVIEAVAGSGKTTTLVNLVDYFPDNTSSLFIAFNKAIVEELKLRLPQSIKCGTFNSIGWSAWISHVRRTIQINSSKTKDIIKAKLSKEEADSYSSFVCRLVAYGKSAGLNPESSFENWMSLIKHHELEYDCSDQFNINRAIDICNKTLNFSIKIADSVCDFDDQIYMPWLRRVHTFKKYDNVIVDEAQDTNLPQKEILHLMLKPRGRVIACGDSRQAIYGFRGSDTNSLKKIRDSFSAVEMPLSISYRCAKKIIAEAQKYNPIIKAWENSPEGEITYKNKYKPEDFSRNDAIICRKNSNLISMAYSFIARGIPVNFLGKDIVNGLVKIININSKNTKNIGEFKSNLNVYLTTEISRLNELEADKAIEALQDKINCINVVMEHRSNISNVAELIKEINEICNGTDGAITLCSFHKSKGREWNKIFILDFGTKIKSSSCEESAWQDQEEINLSYVAITRAKKSLNFIKSNTWE